MTDEPFLRRAIALSRRNLDGEDGGPFGAVVVVGGAVVGEGRNRVSLARDPTAHAEVVAIREACRRLDVDELPGATLYSSCEPCPMCLAAAYWARVERIVFAATRDDAARAGFDDAFLYREVALPPDRRRIPVTHLLGDEARAVFAEWVRKEAPAPD